MPCSVHANWAISRLPLGWFQMVALAREASVNGHERHWSERGIPVGRSFSISASLTC